MGKFEGPREMGRGPIRGWGSQGKFGGQMGIWGSWGGWVGGPMRIWGFHRDLGVPGKVWESHGDLGVPGVVWGSGGGGGC